MTAQTPENLLHQSVKYSLCAEPLGLYLASAPLPWQFSMPHTALSRGYVGTWAIEADRLYLKALDGNRMGPRGLEPVTYPDLFPDYPHGVFAHWFTGELRCPYGERLLYVHGGFSSIYEEDLFLHLNHGVVTGERRVRNGYPTAHTASGFNRNRQLVNWVTN